MRTDRAFMCGSVIIRAIAAIMLVAADGQFERYLERLSAELDHPGRRLQAVSLRLCDWYHH
jgi:hypothetical protein